MPRPTISEPRAALDVIEEQEQPGLADDLLKPCVFSTGYSGHGGDFRDGPNPAGITSSQMVIPSAERMTASPPWARNIDRVIARPSPAPSLDRCREESTR